MKKTEQRRFPFNGKIYKCSYYRWSGFLVPLMLISVFACQLFAEPPVVALDGNPATPEIAPVPGSLIPGEKILVAVSARNIEHMHSYSVTCLFNPEVVTFTGASASLSPLTPAFLESANGKIAAFLAVPGKGSVEIAATQTGKDSTAAVSGNGILGYLSFKAVAAGNPGITISEARIVDPEANSTGAVINH